jgi:diguanylate cyclase (GGDEF)-like protein
MPGLDGLHLCRRLRQENLPFYVYVLLLTAKSRSEEMVEGLDAGADDFISKPINRVVLLARLKAGARTIAIERRLRDLARLDPLTGAMNRRSFHERFSTEWDRASRYGHPLSCAMIDLDFFKKTNDTYGHAAGDAVLQAIARLLESHCRTSDVLARYGGEEFCVLLTETDEAGAAAWAERGRMAIAEARIPFSDQILSVTGSLGVAARPPDITGPEALVALADQALSVAKESGRNRVVPFSTLADRGLDSPDHPAMHAPLDKVLARDVMAAAVYCPHEHESVDCVADLFLQLRLNAAPVVDDQSRLVGIISENDILAVAASNACLNMPIRECMKTNVVQYHEETPAKDVFRFLSRASVPRVVVVSEACPTGVISRATLLRWLRNWSNVHRQSDSAPSTAPVPMRQAGILQAADAAGDCLAALRSHLATHNSDFVPCAVAEATRLEDLAHDILAHCRSQDRL